MGRTSLKGNYGIFFRGDWGNERAEGDEREDWGKTRFGSVGQCPLALFDHAHHEGLFGEARVILPGHIEYSGNARPIPDMLL